MLVALGSDHGGYDLKQEVIGYLKEKGIAFKDFGCMGKESCDYRNTEGRLRKQWQVESVIWGLLSVPQVSVFPLWRIR